MNMFDKVENSFMERRMDELGEKLEALKQDIEVKAAGEMLDEVLYAALKAMSMLLFVDEEYRRNIKDFSATYVIRSKDKRIDVSAIFKKVRVLFSKVDGMVVEDKVVDNPTSTVTFRDGKAMAEFLLAGNPDVISGMLNNQLEVSGNLNYLFKFVYMLRLIPERLGINDFQKMLEHHFQPKEA